MRLKRVVMLDSDEEDGDASRSARASEQAPASGDNAADSAEHINKTVDGESTPRRRRVVIDSDSE